jgi:nuclear pore complex protein Nup93
MGHFADKVQRLNAARLDERPFPVLHEFADVEQRAGGDVSGLFSSIYSLPYLQS